MISQIINQTVNFLATDIGFCLYLFSFPACMLIGELKFFAKISFATFMLMAMIICLLYSVLSVMTIMSAEQLSGFESVSRTLFGSVGVSLMGICAFVGLVMLLWRPKAHP